MTELPEATDAMPPHVWRAIEARCALASFEASDALMHHGATGRTCYAIVSGTVLVTATSRQGATLVLGRRGPGTLVGELAALEGAPRSATVTARDDVTVFVLEWQDLHTLLHEYPDWAFSLLQELAGQLRSMAERYTLRSADLRRRVAEVLITNYDETGDPAFRSSREELAGWVGATREATARTLKQLTAEGLIDLRRGAVTVIDRDRLLR